MNNFPSARRTAERIEDAVEWAVSQEGYAYSHDVQEVCRLTNEELQIVMEEVNVRLNPPSYWRTPE